MRRHCPRPRRWPMHSIICAMEHPMMSRPVAVGLVLLVATVSACGSDQIVTPVSPPQLAIASGDKQFGTPGEALPTPLTVAVTTAAGAPAVGDTISWTLMIGSGSLSTTSVVTDAAGSG